MSSYFTDSGLFDIGSMSSTYSMQSNTAYPLRRGKACAVCRAHKIRCDGVRPVCGSCRRKPKADRCEWDNSQSKSRVAMLIETIKTLEARIFELEHPELITPSVTLHHPYREGEEGSFQHYTPSLGASPRCPHPSYPMVDLSSDSYWDTATASTHTSSSSASSVDGESFTSGPMELEYSPAPTVHTNASGYYQYRKESGPYAASSLSAALVESRSS